MSIETEFLRASINSFQTYKDLADRAMAQVDDEQFFASLDSESNSIAVIVKHISGNMRSRWTEFLTTDGEKPDRDRDSEFEVDESVARTDLMAAWEDGWTRAFDALNSLTPRDLTRTVTLRGEPHLVVKAIGRQLTHAAYHIGQIVFLAKHYAGGSWDTLTIPRGKSQEYNAAMRAGGR